MTRKNPRRSRKLHHWAIPILIFLVAFLPRVIYPVSRSMLWYYRAIHFSDALLERDWMTTYQSYHPGVATMWLSATGLRLFAWREGLSSDQMLRIEPTKPGTIEDAVTAGVVPLALAIALCIALSYVLLRRITDQRIAVVGSFLLALDPFHITHSKVLHVDAVLATLMFVSVLCLFNYLHRKKWRDLVVSGVFAGLAFLSKSPSLFIVPYAILAVGVYQLTTRGLDAETSAKEHRWSRLLLNSIRVMLIWVGVAAVVFVVLWPAMWVEPFTALDRMSERVGFHVGTQHYNPVFFNGNVTLEDPGLPFYLATIAWKATLITLPMACLALVHASLRFRRDGDSRTVWLLAAYVVFFTLQMGLSARKEPRYLLPVFPMLDVMAAFGLVKTAEAIGRIRLWHRWRWLSTILIVLAMALQAGFVLPRHPYYGTHHNTLLGGSQAAQHILPLQDQGEGLDMAAQYLNTLPQAQQARAWIQPLGGELFDRIFIGFTNTDRDPWIDYRVYYVNQVMRRLDSEKWEETWNADRQTIPLWSVAFDGVTYVWVYGAPPEQPAAGGPEVDVDYRLGEHIQLERVRLTSETLVPGGSLTAVLIWNSDGKVKENYTVFCHLLAEDGTLIAQRDGPPIYGVRPTPGWRAGEIIEDSHEILLPDDLAPGEYLLSAGMYDAGTLERLAAYDAAGQRLPEDRIPLRSLRVAAPDTH
jgi:hypothetical protein